ncbi:hypothetical protein NX059_010185 [Plenodomus lindquistii]|nr:hypothetical protein NX059_010185 [Plenodomus lindquistii]
MQWSITPRASQFLNRATLYTSLSHMCPPVLVAVAWVQVRLRIALQTSLMRRLCREKQARLRCCLGLRINYAAACCGWLSVLLFFYIKVGNILTLDLFCSN